MQMTAAATMKLAELVEVDCETLKSNLEVVVVVVVLATAIPQRVESPQLECMLWAQLQTRLQQLGRQKHLAAAQA